MESDNQEVSQPPLWRRFGKRTKWVLAGLSPALSIIGLGGLQDDLSTWHRWINRAVSWVGFEMSDAVAGIFIGAGVTGFLFLALILWGDWAEAALKPYMLSLRLFSLRSLYGLWLYIRITAIGKVPIRYGNYLLDDDQQGTLHEAQVSTKRLPKGKIDHIRFPTQPFMGYGLVIELSALYKLSFSSSGPQLHWNETVTNGRRRYESKIERHQFHRLLGSQRQKDAIWIPLAVVTAFDGNAGWDDVKQVFGWCPLWLFGRKGWAAAQIPDDEEENST